MKKLFGVLAILVAVVLITPFAAHAAQMKFGQPYFLNKGDTVNQNLYFGGQNANIAGDVNGDLIAGGGVLNVSGNVSGDAAVAGGNISISGNVNGNIFAAGGSINISGNVGKSIRAAGGTITVSGTINGDLAVGGGQVYVMPNAVIRGDLLLGGGTADIEGKVMGNVMSGARQLTINNQVSGTTDLNVENLFLGPQAVLSQGLTYHSFVEAKIDPAAKINGPLNFDKKTTAAVPNRNWLGALLGAAVLIKLLILLAISLVFVYFFKKFSGDAAKGSMANWINVWRGFVFLVLAPIVAVILAITVIGIPLAALVLLAYFFTLILAYFMAVIASGMWVSKWIWKKEALDWKTVLLGVVVWIILGWIPILGWIVKCLLVLAAVGSVHSFMHREVWSKR